MIVKRVRIFLLVACYTFSLLASAESDVLIDKPAHSAERAKTEINSSAEQGKGEQLLPALIDSNQPEVGKHVMANMDAGSMILSLLMVLVLIVISAFVLKRFNLTQHDGSQLKVLASLSLGTKERVVVIQAGKQQLLLGVTAQQITLLDHLSEPLIVKNLDTTELPKNILSFLTTRRT
jgi:flagellar protein FliO/FliZ